MKIILSMQENQYEGATDPRFGRCSYFAVIDTDNNETTFEPNGEKDSGSGISAANNVLKLQPDAVIVGNIGPKAFQVLNQAGVPIYSGLKNNIKDTINAFKNGTLNTIQSPNK